MTQMNEIVQMTPREVRGIILDHFSIKTLWLGSKRNLAEELMF